VPSLSPLGLVFFMLVMIGAFAVRSAAGFGAVLIAMPMLAFVLPISTAVSVTTALTAITSIHHVSRDWRRVAWRHFAIMAFYSAIGIGSGFYFIKMLDEHTLRRGLGRVFDSLFSLCPSYDEGFPDGFCALARRISGGHGHRWRPPRHTGFTDGESIFRVTIRTVVLLGRGGSNNGICELRVLRTFEHRVDRHRLAAHGHRLLAGRQGDPKTRSPEV
jgi:hypothetical protein